MTNEELEAMDALEKKATGGKWSAVSDLPLYAVATDKSPVDICASTNRLYRQLETRRFGCLQRDAEFIAASRDFVPKAIAEIRRLREEVELAKERLGPAGWKVVEEYRKLKLEKLSEATDILMKGCSK